MSAVVAERPLTHEQQQCEEARRRVDRETANHCMTVLRDDGLYRHLRFQQPGTHFYWFDLITWPGVLAISGDCGAFMFSRTRDMFAFFAGSDGEINPHYWAQKLTAPNGTRAVRNYSYTALKEHILDWYEDRREELDADEAVELFRALDEQILRHEEVEWSEESAHRLLRAFEHNRQAMFDTWEWDITEWDWQFLWCCCAITTGIARYRFEESYR